MSHKSTRVLLALFVLPALLLTACAPSSPVISHETIFSTRLEGETVKNLGMDDEVQVTEGNYRDIVLLDVLDTQPKQVLFKEVVEGTMRLIQGALNSEDVIIHEGENTFHETVTDEGRILYMTNDSVTKIWTLWDDAGEQLFTGAVTVFLKNSGGELIFVSQRDQGFVVYRNGEKVWESPTPILEWIPVQEPQGYLAVVRDAEFTNSYRVKSSFGEVPGYFHGVVGLDQIDGQIFFMGHRDDGQWVWYLNGEQKELSFPVKEVASVVRRLHTVTALVSTPEGDRNQWYLIDSEGKKENLPSQPSSLIRTTEGWKTLLSKPEQTYSILNLENKDEEDSSAEMAIIPITLATDIWYARRDQGSVHWTIRRGDQEVGVYLGYRAPIQLKDQTYLLGETRDGSVELVEINK
ncbi:MAG: hypothetical protein Q8O95_03440 [bacterium]|nr:hypothetical protein [bacterium]